MRVVPVETERLLAVLQWLRLDVDGNRKSDDALIFSDETGAPITTFRRAWVTAVLKANDIKPTWSKGVKVKGKQTAWKELTANVQNAFRRIDLRWHDLRHEYASRLVEKGVPLSQVRDLLGHASITTTERYDNQQPEALQAAARRLERGLKFDPTVAAGPAKFQDSFQIDDEPLPHDLRSEAPRVGGTSCDEKNLGVWLGGRDSNPDNVVQSHGSYR